MVDNLRLAKQNIEFLKSGLGSSSAANKAPAAPEQKPAAAASETS